MSWKVNPGRWLLCVLFVACPVWAKYGGGSGTAENPYLIRSADQMNTIGTEPNDWDKHFKLTADIDLSRYAGTYFNIIGNGGLPAFTGAFDGDGHTISNFTYNTTEQHYIGIFAHIDGPDARISNLGLINPNVVSAGGHCIGSLAGRLEEGLITNCYAVNAGVSGEGYVGGLVGQSTGNIADCYVTGNVKGLFRIGGLAGENRSFGISSGRHYATGNIERCYAAGNVTGDSEVGGLAGTNYYGTLTDSYSITGVVGNESVGGLAGENYGAVTNCYTHSTVEAEDIAGGLVGRNDGQITACCSSVDVRARVDVGGLVGRNSFPGEIVDCYVAGDIFGQTNVGGLLGYNRFVATRAGGWLYGTVRTSYSAAAVSGSLQVGGLVGNNESSGIYDCFWDIETSGHTTSAGGTGNTTVEMQTPSTFLDAGWDFIGETDNGREDIWTEPEGGGYPILWWQLSPLPELPSFPGGTGESDDPYLIATADELNSIGHKPRLMSAHFKLISDIDLAGLDFAAIASHWYPFRGSFDGNGHTISNFSYNSNEIIYAGFFRCVAGAEIENLGLINPVVAMDAGDFHACLVGHLDTGTVTNCYVENATISGNCHVGGLVGSSGGTITDCYATGNVTGHGNEIGGLIGQNAGTITGCRSNCNVDAQRDDVGGLVGRNGGTITASFSHTSVKGRNAVGGLVGRHNSGEAVNCYARGDVTGEWYVGGLAGTNGGQVGRAIGTIRHCFSTAAILGGSQKGGLLGADWGGEIVGCFWDIETSGRTTSYAGTGMTTAQMQTAATFMDAGWDFAGEAENGTEDIWWILEGRDYPRLWWEPVEDGSTKPAADGCNQN